MSPERRAKGGLGCPVSHPEHGDTLTPPAPWRSALPSSRPSPSLFAPPSRRRSSTRLSVHRPDLPR
ncbi:MAG: hypothetical protein [Olavius algarvensis Gamma 1 endosymbiont]|nr:MAG: hypothetical protein [Olavius algarvensis Gamma 1 endosymbiont]